jgi:hypothetical protein
MSPVERPETGLDLLGVHSQPGTIPPHLAHFYGTMQNPDATNEYMYQMPVVEQQQNGVKTTQAGQSEPLE